MAITRDAAGTAVPVRPEMSRIGGWVAARLDAVEGMLLAAFAALSVALLAVIIEHAVTQHLIWTGTDGLYVVDQMQYLAWIRDAARHVLVSDPFRIAPTDASFLHPGVELSAFLVRLGMPVWVAFLVWKPVAVFGFFAAARAYVHRLITGRRARRYALALALFYAVPVAIFSAVFGLNYFERLNLQFFMHEMWPGFYLWGYPFIALAVAASIGALLSYERARGTRRPAWQPVLLGLVSSWLQPWQGTTLIGIVLLSETLILVLRWRDNRSAGSRSATAAIEPARVTNLLALVTAAAAPLVYYTLLSRLDPSWAQAQKFNLPHGSIPWRELALATAPLIVPAALAYRRWPDSFQELAARCWLLVALGLYIVLFATRLGTYPIGELQGLSVPLAILALSGIRSLHLRWRPAVLHAGGIAAVVAVSVPALVDELQLASHAVGTRAVPHLLVAGEQDALRYLATAPDPGGVLSPGLGGLIPALTGRRTWVGSPSLSPDFFTRLADAKALFTRGIWQPTHARAFVRSTGAKFVLADCGQQFDLTPALRPVLRNVRHFGCATVYELR
jgi:hypothetical protein